jgi:hypothetical protein
MIFGFLIEILNAVIIKNIVHINALIHEFIQMKLNRKLENLFKKNMNIFVLNVDVLLCILVPVNYYVINVLKKHIIENVEH